MRRIYTWITPYQRPIIIAIVVGIISGFGAFLFYKGLQIATSFFMGGLHGYVMPKEGQSIAEISAWAPPDSIVMLLPILLFGSLISGILISRLAPEAEGHGTDAAIKAFHGEGRVRKRIPLLKAVAAVLTISTGGSAGREGPAAQISAGFGSMVSDMLGLTARERRIALTTGIGAGIGTIFKAPLGGAVLAAEILYTRDFESDAIVPAFLASVIGYAIFGFFEGYAPIFAMPHIAWTITQIPFFLLLGILCAAFGLLYIFMFYWTRDRFKELFLRHRIPAFLKPVAGAMILGLIVTVLFYLTPDTRILGLAGMGTGYGYIQLTLYSMIPLLVLLLLPFVKIVTTSLTLGSGGSGGVFAPGLTIGAAVGGSVGMILHMLRPDLVPVAAVPIFVIVGMIALFGGIANAPIAVLIMVVEMTGSITILIPAMAAVAMSQLLTGEKTIFREQVPTKAQSGAHRGEFDSEILERIAVRDVMIPADQVIVLSPDEPASRAGELIARTTHTGFPVIENGRLAGIITARDVRQISSSEIPDPRIRDIMTENLVCLSPDQTLEEAIREMVIHHINHLPVTDPAEPSRLCGFLTRTNVMLAYTRYSKNGANRLSDT